MNIEIKLYNTLADSVQTFMPIDPNKVRMYVCGPTVYDHPHIGNARAVVVYDMLYRILCHKYGGNRVIYARNITDVDDKINQAAKQNKETISNLTDRITKIFHANIAALNCLPPNIEPKATEHIQEIIEMIKQLIANGYAYESEGHIYYEVRKFADYGKLAGRDIEKLIEGARVEVSANKRDAADFVLWKPASEKDDESSIFDSPWGKGRPGWHIECSAMSTKYLSENFDIHGGGADLMFPHHTNEIAQSCGANPGSKFAHYWVHNGFLTVNGEKMSKSLGNFLTIEEMLHTDKIPGEVIRYALISAHYRKPLNWNKKLLDDAKKSLDSFYRVTENLPENQEEAIRNKSFIEAIYDDINTPKAISLLHELASNFNKTGDINHAKQLKSCANMIGLLEQKPSSWFSSGSDINKAEIENLLAERQIAKKTKDFAKADAIRNKLHQMGIEIEDKPDGTSKWRLIRQNSSAD